MKKTLQLGAAGLLALAAILLVSLRIVGYEPRDQSPGLWLTGELVREPVADWSFTDQYEEIFVQTRSPWLLPHSVTTYCATYQDNFYLFSAYYQGGRFPDSRRWNQNVIDDPRARLKIGERLFDVNLSYVEEAHIRDSVHRAFQAKYPEWSSPGLENVHLFLVAQ